MGNVNVNRQAFQGLQKIDAGRDGKIDLKDLQAAADTNGDGKVGLREAANLESELGKYIDKNLATQLAEAAMGSKPVQLSYNLVEPPATPMTGAERITVPLNNVKLDGWTTMENTPADPPSVMRSAQPGRPVGITLGEGVELSKWPPTPVSFTDPETGKPANGFKIEFSTGDVAIIPQGQEINLSKRETPRQGQIMIGGRTQLYRLDEQGRASNDVMTERYATVFCTRRF